MTDHLADARACVTSASQAPDAGCAISWLTVTCEQIIAHLEAQQATQQPATAPPTAQQGDSGHRDGGEAVQAAMAVLCDMGADSGGWHSWRCFDRELYPEPCDCTKQATRAAIAAAEPYVRAKIREQIARELIPVVAHKGPNDTDLSLLDEAAHKLLQLRQQRRRRRRPSHPQRHPHRTTGAAMSYTPTTDEVEHRYAYDELYSMDCEADHHAFRRWLAARDAEVRAQALSEAADEAERHADEGCPSCSNNPVSACSGANQLTAAWLRTRAEHTKEDR